jgi:hypothetical protein
MTRLLLPLLVALLALPANASAAPFTETPHTVLSGSCVRVTGTPGEVAVPHDDGMRVLRATQHGFSAGETIPAEPCAGILTQPSGAGLIVGRETVTARDPGGAWGAAETLAVQPGWDILAITGAVSDRGDAIVAWVEERRSSSRVRVARRAPGGAFGAPELLAGATTDSVQALETGIAATGEAFVLFSLGGFLPPLRVPVKVTIAPPDGPFMAPTDLGEISWGSSPALAVAQDGHALVAVPDGTSLRVAERASGQPFGALEPVAEAKDEAGVYVGAQLRTGGAAAITLAGLERDWLSVLSRPAPGAFARTELKPAVPLSPVPALVFATAGFDEFAGVVPRKPFQVTLAGDQALLVSRDAITRQGATRRAVSATVVPLAGGAFERHVVGGALLDAEDPTALLLADGTPAVMWTDRQRLLATRLHLAAPGAVGHEEPAVPRVRVGRPADTVLKRGERLVLPVSCSGSCEVRGQVLGGSHADDTLQLDRAGRDNLRLHPRFAPIARRRPGPVRILLTYGALGAHQPRTRTVTVRLRRPAEPPEPRTIGLRAERSGDRVRVSWRTDQPTGGENDEYTVFFVTGAATRASDAEPLAIRVAEGRNGKRRFALTLTDASDVKWVTLQAVNVGGFSEVQESVVRVR